MIEAPPQTRFVDEAFAAEYLGMSERFIRKLRQQGKLPSYKFGTGRRYKLEDLNAYAASCLDSEEAA